jgi:transketolase
MTNHLQAGQAGTAHPNQEIFAATLQALAAKDQDLIVVTSDSRGSGKLVPFGQLFPKQLVEVGIAEQNLVGIAAGLASVGKKVFAVSPACFLTARALEQIKNDVAYSDNPVKLIGISAGVSYGALGSTHHSLHDFAVLRTIHNIQIVAPADHLETKLLTEQAAGLTSPVYVRFGKKNMPPLPELKGQIVQIGKGRVVRKGDDLTLVATGETVYPAYLAAERLAQQHHLQACVVSMHTLKPLDVGLLTELAANDRPVLTIEEHSVHGGLGEACASVLMQGGFRNRFAIMGLPDEYTVTGSQLEIFAHYGISEEGIARKALDMLS